MNIQTGQSNQTPSTAEPIRNPANPNHFMFVKPVNHPVRIFVDEKLIAETTGAVRVLETGKTAYDPVLYIPMDDVTAKLESVDKTTHCPLKGDASYHAFGGKEIGWSYATLDFASVLQNRIAFSAADVTVIEN